MLFRVLPLKKKLYRYSSWRLSLLFCLMYGHDGRSGHPEADFGDGTGVSKFILDIVRERLEWSKLVKREGLQSTAEGIG